jgi:hypothetical protein
MKAEVPIHRDAGRDSKNEEKGNRLQEITQKSLRNQKSR